MPYPRPTLTALRTQARQDLTSSDLPNANGFLRRAALRVLADMQAGMAHMQHGHIDWVALQSTPFTATGEYLEAWAALAPTPVLRQLPTSATGTFAITGGTPTTVLPAGTVIQQTGTPALQYATTAAATVAANGTLSAPFTASATGSAYNASTGTPLSLGTSVPGIPANGTAATAITGGTDLELDSSLRARMLQSYANPPAGGSASDYQTFALAVPGVTRAWVGAELAGAGTVTVFFMMDVAEAAFNGFPQGTNGVATAETRVALKATGDQLAVANAIFPKRPVTAIVYANAPVAAPQNFTIHGMASAASGIKTQVQNAIAAQLANLANPATPVGIEQSDIEAGILAVPGAPSFDITTPSVWPLTAAVGSIITCGTVTFT